MEIINPDPKQMLQLKLFKQNTKQNYAKLNIFMHIISFKITICMHERKRDEKLFAGPASQTITKHQNSIRSYVHTHTNIIC